MTETDQDVFDKALSSGPASDDLIVDGEIDMRIARDGEWFYLGSPITRKPLVKLFSTVLRLEPDGHYYLITPVERARIIVEDAPFTAVEMTIKGLGRDQVLSFRTNVDDEVTVDADHPLRVEIDAATGEPSPYVTVRYNLRALIVRAVFYDLVNLGVEQQTDLGPVLGVWSSGEFFEIGSL